MNTTSQNAQAVLCNVAILAGGQGTRLASRSGELPKPMVPILGKPVLQHQIELCRKHGVAAVHQAVVRGPGLEGVAGVVADAEVERAVDVHVHDHRLDEHLPTRLVELVDHGA